MMKVSDPIISATLPRYFATSSITRRNARAHRVSANDGMTTVLRAIEQLSPGNARR